MKKLLLLTLIPFILFGCGEIPEKNCPTKNSERIDISDLEKFSMEYFRENSNKEVVPFINTLDDVDFFQTPARNPILWFLAEIFATTPEKINKWIIQDMCGLNEKKTKQWDFLTTALWMSNSQEARDTLKMIQSNSSINGKKFIQELLERDSKKTEKDQL